MSSNTRRKKKNFLFGGFSNGNQATLTDSQFGFTQKGRAAKDPSRETTPFMPSRSTSHEDAIGQNSIENDLDLRLPSSTSPTPPRELNGPAPKRPKRSTSVVVETQDSQQAIGMLPLAKRRGRPPKNSTVRTATRLSTQLVADSQSIGRESVDLVAETHMSMTEVVMQTPEKDMPGNDYLMASTSSGYQTGMVAQGEADLPQSQDRYKTTGIGLLVPSFEIDHDRRDYVNETVLDDLKRRDNVEFKDLRRKDQRPNNIVDEALDFMNTTSTQQDGPRRTFKKFRKAKQGCYFYGRENSIKPFDSSGLVTYIPKATALADEM